MKKLFFACLMILAAAITAADSKAQVYSMLSTVGNTSDTVANTATEVLTKQVPGTYSVLAVQAVVTKISGTAAGTVILQGSIDGTNYYAVGDDTLTMTDVASKTHIWVVTPSKYLYYRLSYTGSGTMSCRLQGTLMARK